MAACADGHRQRAYATGSLASHAHTRLFLALQIIVPLTGERPSESKFNTKLTIKTIMIEQRTMFVVEPSHNISEILAMYDTEKKEVLYYEQEGEVYKRLKDEKYFATRQLAEDYRTKHQAELRAKFPEIRAFVEEMDNVIEEYFNFDEQEFFGRCAHFGGYHASWRKEYERELKRAKIFRECVRTGYLNINAHSFRPADVEYIKWYSEKAELHLKDSDYTIETADADEYELILDIFGPNRSGYSYNEV